MRHVVRELKQAALFGWREVRDITETMQEAPLCAEFPEAIDPHLGSGLIVTFREDNQAALLIAVDVTAPFQQRVEALADLFRSSFNRIFSMAMGCLLDNRAEETDRSVRSCDDASEVIQHPISDSLLLTPPKTLSTTDMLGMEVDRWAAREVL